MQVLRASKIFYLTASTEGSWFLSWNVTVPRLQAWTGLGTLGSWTDIFAEDCNLNWARSPSWTCEQFQKLGIVELRWHGRESDAAESCGWSLASLLRLQLRCSSSSIVLLRCLFVKDCHPVGCSLYSESTTMLFLRCQLMIHTSDLRVSSVMPVVLSDTSCRQWVQTAVEFTNKWQRQR